MKALFDLGCLYYSSPETLAFIPYYRALPPVEADYQQAILNFDRSVAHPWALVFTFFRHLSVKGVTLETSRLLGQLYVKVKDYLGAKPHLEVAAQNCTSNLTFLVLVLTISF